MRHLSWEESTSDLGVGYVCVEDVLSKIEWKKQLVGTLDWYIKCLHLLLF